MEKIMNTVMVMVLVLSIRSRFRNIKISLLWGSSHVLRMHEDIVSDIKVVQTTYDRASKKW